MGVLDPVVSSHFLQNHERKEEFLNTAELWLSSSHPHLCQFGLVLTENDATDDSDDADEGQDNEAVDGKKTLAERESAKAAKAKQTKMVKILVPV